MKIIDVIQDLLIFLEKYGNLPVYCGDEQYIYGTLDEISYNSANSLDGYPDRINITI